LSFPRSGTIKLFSSAIILCKLIGKGQEIVMQRSGIKIQIRFKGMFKLKNLLFTALLSLLAVLPVEAGEKIVIAGTGDSQALLREVALAYQQSHPGSTVEIQDSIGSSGGIRLVAAGRADLGRVARHLRENEKGYNLHYRQFASAPVVFAIHPEVVGVDGLTDREVIDIYSGKIGNWRDLGGTDRPILVVNREPGDSSRTILEQHIEGFREISRLAGRIIYSTSEAAETIARYRNTIGYLPLSEARAAGLKVLRYNHIEPDGENLRQGLYPLAMPLGIVWKGKPTGPAADFLAYLTGREAVNIYRTHGVEPVL